MITTKYGSRINLNEFHYIDIRTDLAEPGGRSAFKCTVIACQVFKDMYGEKTISTMDIQDFDSLLAAQTYAIHLRALMPTTP